MKIDTRAANPDKAIEHILRGLANRLTFADNFRGEGNDGDIAVSRGLDRPPVWRAPSEVFQVQDSLSPPVMAYQGGTGFEEFDVGDTLYADTPVTLAKLPIGAATAVMRSTGAVPAWTSPAALTRVNDTNVTLALGGAPATSLLAATSLTMGWTGTLAAARLNGNVVQSVANDTNVTGSIAAQNLTLGWTGTLAAGRLNSNVVQAVTNDTNVTGVVAAQNLTLGWTGTLAAARLNANVVQSVVNDTNVTGSVATQALTLGWTGLLGLARGGTNANLSATGGASKVLQQVSVGAAITVNQLAFTDISGLLGAGQLPTGITFAGAVLTITGNILPDGARSLGTAAAPWVNGIFGTPIDSGTGNDLVLNRAGSTVLSFGVGYAQFGTIRISAPSLLQTPGLNTNGVLLDFGGTLNEHSSGTHARMSLMELAVPSITGGGAGVTNAQTLYIAGPPAAAGAVNRSIWVDAGDVKLDDSLDIGGSLTLSGASPRTFQIGSSPSTDGAGFVKFIVTNAARNWQIDANSLIGGLSFTPSTASGGSTFTTPILSLDVVSGNVTIGAPGGGGTAITLITAASSATRAGLRIPSGTAPTVPITGDVWFEGGDFKGYDGVNTVTFVTL